VALNQLINVAVAEKLSALRTQAFFRARTRDANVPEAIEILNRLGRGNPPAKGDKLPEREKRYPSETDRKGSKKAVKVRMPRASAKKHAPRSS
jgi:hypothetical protein